MDSAHSAFWTVIATVVPVIALVAIVEFRRTSQMPGVRRSRATHRYNAISSSVYTVALVATEWMAVITLAGVEWPDTSFFRALAAGVTMGTFALVMIPQLVYVWTRGYDAEGDTGEKREA